MVIFFDHNCDTKLVEPGFPLGLTSPQIAGRLVREAQRALATNEFGDFQPGRIDGIFGEETARAIRRAKYWLGYEEANQTAAYGQILHSFLIGTAPLPRDQQRRRDDRLREKVLRPTDLWTRALKEAERHIGTKEDPSGSNRQQFGVWYGMNGVPWCAIFVTYCYVISGSTAFVRGSRYAYCPYVVNDARSGRNNLAVTRHPTPGDLVLYDWANDGVADHIGMFRDWVSRDHSFRAIEGNTSMSNNSNGGEVQVRERSMNDVVCFVHVGK